MTTKIAAICVKTVQTTAASSSTGAAAACWNLLDVDGSADDDAKLIAGKALNLPWLEMLMLLVVVVVELAVEGGVS